MRGATDPPSDPEHAGGCAVQRPTEGRPSAERERNLSVANTAESLLKTERVAQDRLAQQVKQIEAENMALKGDLDELWYPPCTSGGPSSRNRGSEGK